MNHPVCNVCTCIYIYIYIYIHTHTHTHTHTYIHTYIHYIYRKVAGSIPVGVIGFFIDIKSFRSHYCLGVDSASNRNEYQEHFLGVRGGRCVRLTTLPPFWAIVMKSGNLNFLEPSGPLQACDWTALPFIYIYIYIYSLYFAICVDLNVMHLEAELRN